MIYYFLSYLTRNVLYFLTTEQKMDEMDEKIDLVI